MNRGLVKAIIVLPDYDICTFSILHVSQYLCLGDIWFSDKVSQHFPQTT